MLGTTKQEQPTVLKKSLRASDIKNLWLGRIVIWIVIIAILFPVISIVAASLAKGESFSQAGRIFPKEITFDNYTKVLKETNFISWVKNSLIVCFSVSIIQLLMTAPAAYAFSRLRFKGRRNGLMFLLLLQMFPSMMALPAILAIAFRLNLMDQLWGVILLQCGGSAYNIWLLKGFMDGIPKELDEAACVDGATPLQTFIRIVLPLTRSMLVVIFVFAFIGAFGEYAITSALIKDPQTQTVAVGLMDFVNNKYSTNWTEFAAAAVMGSLPIVILMSAVQKFIAKGLVAGAVKG